MPFWSKLQAQYKATEVRDYLATLVQPTGGRPISEPDPSMYDNQAELMQRLTWVNSAVGIVGETAAAHSDLDVFRLEGNDKIEIDNHPVNDLLDHPNDFESRFELFEAMVGFLRLNGNSYLWMYGLDPQGPPQELWTLRPNRIRPIPDAQNKIRGYEFRIQGHPIIFDADEIIHIKRFHPRNDWVGLSAIESIALGAELDFKQQQYQRNFFDADNAKVPGALAFADYVDDTLWKRLKAQMKEEHGGTRRQMMLLRGAGAGGVQWVPMGLTQQDMQYLESRRFTKEEIYEVLAPGLLNILAVNATEANALAGEKTFREYCIWPILRRISEKFNSRLLPRFGEGQVCEFEDIRHRDRAIEMQEQNTYAQSHVISEIRKKYYGDAELGDERDDMLPIEVPYAVRSGSLGVSAPPDTGPQVDGGNGGDGAATDQAQASVDNAEQSQANEATKALFSQQEARETARVYAIAQLAEDGIDHPTEQQVSDKLQWLYEHINEPAQWQLTAKRAALARAESQRLQRAAQEAKAIERAQFRQFAQRRIKEKHPERIREFTFKSLGPGEQQSLFAELNVAPTVVPAGGLAPAQGSRIAAPRTFTRVLMLTNMNEDEKERLHMIDEAKRIRDILQARLPATLSFIWTPQDLEQTLAAFNPQDTILFNWCEDLPGWVDGGETATEIVERLGFAHTASSIGAQAMAFDRAQTFFLLRAMHVLIPNFKVIYTADDLEDFNYWPALVRPLTQHGSVALKQCADISEAREAVEQIFGLFKPPAMLVEYVEGREFSVGLWSDGAKIETFPILERDFTGDPDRIEGEDDKAPDSPHTGESNIVPAQLEPIIESKLIMQSVSIFRRFSTKIYGRTDWRLAQGSLDPVCIDVNPEPDISIDSTLMAMARKGWGMTHEQLILGILDRGIAYYRALDGGMSADMGAHVPMEIKARPHDQAKRTAHEQRIQAVMAGYFKKQAGRIRKEVAR